MTPGERKAITVMDARMNSKRKNGVMVMTEMNIEHEHDRERPAARRWK